MNCELQNQNTNQVWSMPRIGDPAPEFRAMTTKGKLNFPSDYGDSWKILFSHPADFTPVCTTEFIAFANMQEEFEKLNTKIVGLSVDSLSSHIAWVRNIKEKIVWDGNANVDINFPIIVDLSKKVSNLYGMLMPGESNNACVRAVFFIDPKNIVRAIIYYPLVLGRNFDEIKRVIIALQTADAHDVALPANWVPGKEAVLHSPITTDEAQERCAQEGINCSEWYLCTKKL
ncbi:MAG: peroxiredoxin [Bacteroidales bacterium]|nr:peroxiredoxin [Bacteroidales bacterium]